VEEEQEEWNAIVVTTNYQLSLMDPRDGIMLTTELNDHSL